MPYISAAIIFQLFGTVSRRLKQLQEEGPTGRQKIQEWTRLATVGLCIIQAIGWLKCITAMGLVYEQWASSPIWWVMAVVAMTAGTVFLMWLGEQIDKYGIGNGVSMIIMAGILAQMPSAVLWVKNNFQPGDPSKMGLPGLLFLIAGFVIVVAGSVIMTVAQRRIPIQQAKHTRGRKVFGGQRSYLPLRVNHGGVMPVIFASSLMIFPSVIFGMLYQQLSTAYPEGGWAVSVTRWLNDNFNFGSFPYTICEMALIYFFSYFWITVQFNPEEMAKQLKEHGSFIPGLRPGPRTAEYLETVMEPRHVRGCFVPGRHRGRPHGRPQEPERGHGGDPVPRRHRPADRRQCGAGLHPARRGEPADAELRRLPRRPRGRQRPRIRGPRS